MTDLKGKTALVTGASRGIGRASALALAKLGAQVLVHYGRGANEAEDVVAEIRKIGGRADAIGADLAAPDGPHKLARQVRAIVGDRLELTSDRGRGHCALHGTASDLYLWSMNRQGTDGITVSGDDSLLQVWADNVRF